MIPPSIITFDCYGTLVDWEGGIAGAFARKAAEDGVTVDRSAVLSHYAVAEARIEGGPYISYREVLGRVATEVAREIGWALDPSQAGFLAESLPSWTAFPDTNRALRRLTEAGIGLAILSNTDRDLIAATLKHLEVEFEFVITAEEVRSYKPAPGHFLAARERIGQRPWMHAGASLFHDMAPTRRMGVPNAWINRKAEAMPQDPQEEPDIACLDLLAFSEAVMSL